MSHLTQEFSFTLPASPERVFAALIEPQQLRRWFAEQVDVELRVGGAYRFWGRHTYGAPQLHEASQTIRAFESGKSLSYGWHLAGEDSVVTLTLEPAEQEGSTTLKGTHHFERAPTLGRAREMVDDLWKLNIGNLSAHLQGGAGLLLPDYADPSPKIELSVLIDAPREQVFRTLIDPALIDQWAGGKAAAEPRVGGKLSYGWNYKYADRDVQGGPTRIIDMVENERLVTDWPDWRGDPEVPPTSVTWLLQSVGKQTRLTLIHGNFPRAVDFSDYPFGWGYFLGKIAEVAQSIAPGPL